MERYKVPIDFLVLGLDSLSKLRFKIHAKMIGERPNTNRIKQLTTHEITADEVRVFQLMSVSVVAEASPTFRTLYIMYLKNVL